jgi:hypothetical protein
MLPCLCSRKKPSSISSMPCQSLRPRFIPRIRNQLFSQSHDSCLQSRSAPSPSSPRLLSRLHLVFASISTMSSLQYRRYTLQSVLRLTYVFPTSPSAIFNFLSPRLRQCTLVFRSYYFNLFSTRFSTPTHPPLLVSSPIAASSSLRRYVASRRTDVEARGPRLGGGNIEGRTKGTCRGKPSRCTKRNTAGGGLQRIHKEG